MLWLSGGFSSPNPKGASRAIPAPARRASARCSLSLRRIREKRHRYGRAASSGSYVANDPVNKTDPTGEIPFVIGCALNPACRTAAGAGVGALIGGGAHVIQNGIPRNAGEWREVGIASAAGAVNGAAVVNGRPPAATGAVTGAVQRRPPGRARKPIEAQAQ